MKSALTRFSFLPTFRLFAVAGALVTSGWAQQINTGSSWNGSDAIAPFGEEDTSTYGQTFRVPAGFNAINSFSFTLRSLSGGDVDFAAYVAEWDGWKYTGPLLYTSTHQVLAANTSVFTPFTFSTGALLLDPAKNYVAFLSASNFFDGINGLAEMASVGEVYSGGNFVFFNNGSDFSLLRTSEWDETGRGTWGDAVFSASFSSIPVTTELGFTAVPEPSTYGLLGILALGGVVASRRFRSRAKV